MISTIIIMIAALAWLMYETDYMRVRLLVGESTQPIVYKTWEELKPCDVRKTDAGWLRFPKSIAPLTGWDWLLNTMHIIPEYKVELIAEHSKITMRTQNTSILRDCFRVYRNPYLKVKL